MSAWDDLSIREKSDIMKVAIQNGILKLNDIKEKYNSFAEGGPVNDNDLVDFIIKEEGFLSKPKNIGDGKITLGSGLTATKWHNLYKKRGNKWSEADNRMAVAEEVANRRRWAEKNVPNWDSLPSSSQKALLSYKYNFDFNRKNSPKLFKALEDSNFYEAARQINATSRNAKFKKGTSDRRGRERTMFLSELPKESNPMVPYTPIIASSDNTAIVNPFVGYRENIVPRSQLVPDEDSFITAHTETPIETKINDSRRNLNSIMRFNRFMNNLNQIYGNVPQYTPDNSFIETLAKLANNTYAEGGDTKEEKSSPAMLGMMKSKLATAAHFGNPTARRMTNYDTRSYTWPNEYEYDNGIGEPKRGNVYVSSYDNLVTPQIQDNGSSLEFVNKENLWSTPYNDQRSYMQSIKFDNAKDAQYFGEHYKEIAPMMNIYAKGGNLYGGLNKNSQKMKIGRPYYSYDKNGNKIDDTLNINVTLPEVVVTPDSKKSPAQRAIDERFRRNVYNGLYGQGVYDASVDKDLTNAAIAKSNKEWENSLERKVLQYGQAAASGVGLAADMMSGLPVYSTLKGASTFNRATTPEEYIESALWLSPVAAGSFKPIQNAVGEVVTNTADNINDAYKAWKVSKAISKGVKENPVITAYNKNPYIKDYGTLYDYQSYLDNVFPDSKIHDILWHGSKIKNLQKFSTEAIGSNMPIKGSVGMYLAPERYTATAYGKKGEIYPVLLNTQNPYITDQIFAFSKDGVNVAKISPKVKNTFLADNDAVISPHRGEIAFFNPDDALILGSNEDAAGFYKFMSSAPNSKFSTVRTRVGDVEIDNPNLLYHLDRGDNIGAFNGGAYIQEGFLYPGAAKASGQSSYSWWNLGKPYATSINGEPMTRLMTTTPEVDGMLHVRSQNYPIGQWNGTRGFVLPSEYVNPRKVDVRNYVYNWDPKYGYKKQISDVTTINWEDANSLKLSELNWKADNWFKAGQNNKYTIEDVKALQSHIPEYLQIEKEAKKRGTWLKMPDGSEWPGDARSWVQLMSRNAQKHSPDVFWTGIDKDISPVYSGTLWGVFGRGKVPMTKARTYASKDTNTLPMFTSSNINSSVFNAAGSKWSNIDKKALGAESIRRNITTNDLVEAAQMRGDKIVKILNVADSGPHMVHPKSEYYMPNISNNLFYPQNNIILADGVMRKSLLGNNGNFDNSNNIFRTLIPVTIGSNILALKD